MRRLLTGYAVSFNQRHKRSGHLFQNRYKSILCEEETCLLELLRYIHLNPLRAGVAPELPTLDSYPWCGHAELLGSQPAIGLGAETVLQLFGKNLKSARYAYQQFVADGLNMGKRPELVGGGLRRSLALDPGAAGTQDYDERVPGSGDFVDSLRQERLLGSPCSPQLGLSKLQEIIESSCQLPARGLAQRGRLNAVAESRALFYFCAVRWQGHTGTAVGHQLGVGSSSVTRAVRREEVIINGNQKLQAELETRLKQ